MEHLLITIVCSSSETVKTVHNVFGSLVYTARFYAGQEFDEHDFSVFIGG